MDDGTEFGKYVAWAREQREWTRTELLKRVSDQGVYLHATSLKRIEDGDQVAKIHEAAAICRAFGVSVDAWSTSNRARFQRYVDGRISDMRAVRSALDQWENGKREWPGMQVAGEDTGQFDSVFQRANMLHSVRADQLVSEWEKRREQADSDDAPDWWQWVEGSDGPAS